MAESIPSAPAASDVKVDKAEQEVGSIPWNLRGWSGDKLGSLSGAGLALLCTRRGLAKGGTLADKTARLLKWKKECKAQEAPAGPVEKKRKGKEQGGAAPPAAPPASTRVEVSLQLHVHSAPESQSLRAVVAGRSQEDNSDDAEANYWSSGGKRAKSDYDLHPSEGEAVMSFGKHKGRRYSEIFDTDPGYVKWIIGQPVVSNLEMNHLQSYFNARVATSRASSQSSPPPPPPRTAPAGASAKGSDILNVGKHKGLSFEEILKSDRGYAEWVVRQEDLKGDLAQFQQYCIQKSVVNTNSSSKSGSQSSQPPPPATSKSASHGTFTGGKHAGKTFAEVLRTDRDYALWISELPDSEVRAGWMREFKQFLAKQKF